MTVRKATRKPEKTKKLKVGALVYMLRTPTLPGDKGTSPCDVSARWGFSVIEDIIRATKQWSFDGTAESTTGIKIELLRADQVEDKPMEFLCEDRILLRMLNGLCGNPGSGKTWVSLRTAADGSKGKDTFSEKKIKPFNTLYWTNESLPETIRRRFKAMGGDLTRLFILTGATDSKGRPVNLTLENITELEQAVIRSRAKLLVVDPLQSFLGARVNMNQANETRPLLDGLSALADKHNLAVIVIRHLRKDGSGHSSGAALGSIDITAKFRTEYLVGKMPDGSGQQVLAHLKFGELQQQPSLELKIEGKNAEGTMVWKGVTPVTAQQLLAPEQTDRPKKSDDAAEYLIDALKNGARDSKEIEKNSPVSRATLYRAAVALGVKMEGDKKNVKRLWSMPKFAVRQTSEERTTPDDDDATNQA